MIARTVRVRLTYATVLPSTKLNLCDNAALCCLSLNNKAWLFSTSHLSSSTLSYLERQSSVQERNWETSQ